MIIEKFFDRIGRAEISRATREADDENIDVSRSLNEAHRRIDLLRHRTSLISQQNNFDDSLDYVGRQLAVEWRRRDANQQSSN